MLLVRRSLLASECDWKKGQNYVDEMPQEQRLQEVHRDYDGSLRSYLEWYRVEYETRYHRVFDEYRELHREYLSLGGQPPEEPRDVGGDSEGDDAATLHVLRPREALTVTGLAARAGWNWVRWRLAQR